MSQMDKHGHDLKRRRGLRLNPLESILPVVKVYSEIVRSGYELGRRVAKETGAAAADSLSAAITHAYLPFNRRNLTEIDVYIYLDTDDNSKAQWVAASVDELLDVAGFDGPLQARVERGSFIRRSRAARKNGITASQARTALANIERIAELYSIDEKRVQVDSQFANLMAALIKSLDGIENACIRAGSTVILKYEENGRTVIRTRPLTLVEVRALEKYPEIQNSPKNMMEALAMAVEKLEESPVSAGLGNRTRSEHDLQGGSSIKTNGE